MSMTDEALDDLIARKLSRLQDENRRLHRALLEISGDYSEAPTERAVMFAAKHWAIAEKALSSTQEAIMDIATSTSPEVDALTCTCGEVSFAFGEVRLPTPINVVHNFEGKPCRYGEPLSNKIQVAIEDEARLWGDVAGFYRPAPGQIWSHVANRVTGIVMRVLKDEGLA